MNAAAVLLAEERAEGADLRRILDALNLWEKYASEYASTPAGEQDLSEQAVTADQAGDVDTATAIRQIIKRGHVIRAANTEATRAIRARNDR